MWISKSYVKGLEKQLAKYQTGELQRQNDLDRAEREKSAAEAKAAEETSRNASVAVDWEAMDPFSIERLNDRNGKGSATNIGYFIKDNAGNLIVKEWILYCSLERHEELVKEFIKYRGK